MRINAVNTIVEQVLAEEPATRDNDMELYLKVCEICNPATLSMPFAQVLKNLNFLGVPNIDTVGRTRRKLQEKNADYRGSKRVTEARYTKFKEVLDYVRE